MVCYLSGYAGNHGYVEDLCFPRCLRPGHLPDVLLTSRPCQVRHTPQFTVCTFGDRSNCSKLQENCNMSRGAGEVCTTRVQNVLIPTEFLTGRLNNLIKMYKNITNNVYAEYS